jgi:hypothetical protein
MCVRGANNIPLVDRWSNGAGAAVVLDAFPWLVCLLWTSRYVSASTHVTHWGLCDLHQRNTTARVDACLASGVRRRIGGYGGQVSRSGA